ncbi:hypothetical protein KI688_011096 [Linnemannia hyalina]|uniref:Uncharacterized protein n=1 Tax=Linnemannia hyalina TaxID=64524 RepID=A0A9P7XX06_9FUNG|nr:hypothetical protein KI688_011096 [Linnemannia hyalina]
MRFTTTVTFLAAAAVVPVLAASTTPSASPSSTFERMAAEMETCKSEFNGHIEVHKLTKIAPTSEVPAMRCVTLPIENLGQDALPSGHSSTHLGSDLPYYIIGALEVKRVSVGDFGSIEVMIGNLIYVTVLMVAAFTTRPEYLRRTLHESYRTSKSVMVSPRSPSEFIVVSAQGTPVVIQDTTKVFTAPNRDAQ